MGNLLSECSHCACCIQSPKKETDAFIPMYQRPMEVWMKEPVNLPLKEKEEKAPDVLIPMPRHEDPFRQETTIENEIKHVDRTLSDEKQLQELQNRVQSRYDPRLIQAFRVLLGEFIAEKCELKLDGRMVDFSLTSPERSEAQLLGIDLEHFCTSLWDFAWNQIDTDLLKAFEIRKVRNVCNDIYLIVVELEKHLPFLRLHGHRIIESGIKNRRDAILYGIHIVKG